MNTESWLLIWREIIDEIIGLVNFSFNATVEGIISESMVKGGEHKRSSAKQESNHLSKRKHSQTGLPRYPTHLTFYFSLSSLSLLYSMSSSVPNVEVNNKCRVYCTIEANIAVEDLFIGLSVLQHLGVYTKTLVMERQDLLDEPACSSISSPSTCLQRGRVSKLIIARLNRFAIDADVPVAELDHDRLQSTSTRLGNISILSRTLHFWKVSIQINTPKSKLQLVHCYKKLSRLAFRKTIIYLLN